MAKGPDQKSGWRRRPQAAASAALAGALLLGAGPALAEPALWKISDADSTVYLFGSVHSLPPALDWRTEQLETALTAADVVYFEAPLDLVAQAQLQALVLRLGYNPPDEPLTGQLDAATADRLVTMASDLGVPQAQLDRMKPWLAFMLLSAKIAEAGGADPTSGVETILTLEATRQDKEIRGFETLAEQTMFFADMPQDAQIAMLAQAVSEMDDAADMMTALLDAWVEGDLDTLETVIFEGVEALPPVFFDVIFRKRNEAWADEIAAFMAGAGDALVVVGAGHLVGADSVQDMLAERGYAAERW